jgi:hypothetical protein
MAQQWIFDKAKFILLFPEYAIIPDALFEFFALTAETMFNPQQFAIPIEKWDVFYFWLIAHLIAIHQRGSDGGVGSIASASEGSVSVSYNAAVIKDGAFWNQTNYGQMFWRLIRPYLSPKFVSGKPSGVL